MKTCFFLLLAGLALQTSGADRLEEIRRLSAAQYAGLEELYVDLHTHPELSLHEERTAGKIAEELRRAHFTVSTNVGGYGVVGVLANGAGPVVLIRTDLDGLPVKEETGLPHASKARARDDSGKEVDVMHACGHDIHMSCFTGTARLLDQLRSQWKGTVIMIGQPAEERGKGAKKMLDAGLLTRFPKPDFCLALHTHAALPVGKIGFVEGYALANVDSVNVTLRGVGGHGAFPQLAKDPVVLAAQTVLALQTIVSRETEPIEPAVVTVGSIHGGTKHNIIPAEVVLQLTLRSYSDEVRIHSIESVKRITRGLAISAGIPEDRMPIVVVEDEFTPSTYNNPALVQRLTPVWQSLLGSRNVEKVKPVMGGEDFGMYGRTEERIPICIFWLGVVDPEVMQTSLRTGKPLPSLHSPLYAPKPESIKTGVAAMTSAALELLAKSSR